MTRPSALDTPRGLRLDAVAIDLKGERLLSVDHLVEPGETLTIMGPSGTGKSTLLAFIGGFLDPVFETGGDVRLDGRSLLGSKPQDRRCGVLFQDALLFPHMSVAGNLVLAIPQAVVGSERRDRMENALESVGLGGFGPRDPATLSGGQKARVALARTLLSQPLALLLDEPFSKLDAPLRAAMRDLVFGRIADEGLPALLVTHDEADAAAAAGPIIEIGTERVAGLAELMEGENGRAI